MEEKYSFDTTFFTGDPKGGKWSGIFVTPTEGGRASLFGKLYVVISLSAPEEFDSRMAGDLLSENLQDVYYNEGNERNIIARLEKAIMSTAKRLEHLLDREEVAAESGIDLNIEALVTYKEYVYMAILGEGSILLERDDRLISLSDGLKDLSGRGLIKTGSGKFKENDNFVLLSPQGGLTISEKDMQNVVRDFNFDRIKGVKQDSLLGILLLRISNKAGEALLHTDSKFESEKINQIGKKETKVEEEDDVSVKEYEESKLKIPQETGRDEELEKAKRHNDLRKGNSIKNLKDKVTDKETYKVVLIKLKEFGQKLLVFGKTHIWEGLLGMSKRGMYLKGAGPKTSIRGIIVLIIVVVCLLYISIRGIQRHSDTNDKKTEIMAVLSDIDEKFNNGRNLGAAGNIAEAVAVLEEALGSLSSIKEYGIMTDEIRAKEEEGYAIMDDVRKVILLDDGNIITDIAGYIEGAQAADMTMLGSRLYVSDPNLSTIYELSVEGGEVYSVVGEDTDLRSPSSIVFDGEGDMIIFDGGEGILKLHLDEKKVERLAGLSSTSVGEVKEIDNYVTPDGTNILYLLRPSKNDVRKITKYSSGYSLPELRLSSTQFGGAKDMEIDGKIYILTQADGIVRYFGEKLDPYALVGLDKSINDASCLELDDFLVYVGDSANRRVVVVTKGGSLTPDQGRYVGQIIYRGENNYLSNIKDIIVDNEGRVMYILDETKIFRVELTKVDEYKESLE
ncbi:hypothetical protein JW766_01125 [Candidatus Dojkabacteria bacterium]|nr:hypothetical protein [Candidatus Dojkabacteria bacterium]